jgi:hypothetical protein
MSEATAFVRPSSLPRVGDEGRAVAPSRMGETVATLHILPLHPRKREFDRHEWALVWERLEQIARLPIGWNGTAGVAPDLQTILFAGQQLANLQPRNIPAPIINPSPDGAIYAEWHAKGLDIELIFEAPYRVLVLAEDARREIEPFEVEGPDVGIAYGALKVLSAR